jgi:predicted DCC family thiol-disulfide oxidoreductase YuxK
MAKDQDSAPVIIFDGECEFCRQCISWVEARSAHYFESVPFQKADLSSMGLTWAECVSSVQLVEENRTYSGSQAVSRILMKCGRPQSLLGTLLAVPGISWIAKPAYKWIAGNRDGRIVAFISRMLNPQ